MKILYTTPVLQHPPAGGPALRIENSLRALQGLAEVYLASRVAPWELGWEAEEFYRSHATAFFYTPSLSSNKYVRTLQHYLLRSRAEKDARFLLRYMNARNIDVLWAGYGNISYDLIRAVKRMSPRTKIVCDTDSVWSRYVLRELPFETSPARRREIEQRGRRKEQEEREWVNLCEITTAVSEVDAAYYRSLAADSRRVMLFSNVIDVAAYAQKPPPPPGFRSPSIYLAGTFTAGSAMEHAARWLISDVLPHVWNELPDAHVSIVGQGSDRTLADVRDPRISITGRVQSVLPWLCNASVAVVPLFFESGTRFKILEAGACAVPLVSTTLGAEGLAVRDGQELLIADEPAEFARAIVRLVRDRTFALELAERCKTFVETHCGMQTLSAEATAILAALGA